MRIEIPVITRCGPPLTMDEGGCKVVNSKGETTWQYKGVEVTGKGIYIAACARSGTVYITEVLKELGYKIGHEATDIDGSVGYHLAVVKPDNCFHQVRHPLKQIASMLDHQSWGFMNQVIECEGRGLLGCMQYWLLWNELIEEFCIWRYRIEQLPDIWEEFLDRIDHQWEPLPEVRRKNTREDSLPCRTKEFTKLNWAQLIDCNSELAQKIYDKHLEYGYSPIRDTEETHQISGHLERA
jgi:hypothetical protein